MTLDYRKQIKIPQPEDTAESYVFGEKYHVNCLIISSEREKTVTYYLWFQADCDTSSSYTISVIEYHIVYLMRKYPKLKNIKCFLIVALVNSETHMLRESGLVCIRKSK